MVARRKRRTRSNKRWMQGAVKRPGSFRAAAKRAGMSTAAFARKVMRKNSRYSTRMKRKANLALIFMRSNKKRRRQ
ncbi:MAG: hypothetical protein HPY87_08975 [Fervidobacterium sp.]|uniref:hypothetical protein n=1 Tax=Fervidobacterium sp. TaxID=1871331 RepID=UPI0025C000B4|nr:hypothetical protein [Fervidobacterium sp.]NPU89993.1 hypothetical protein [Fervidobacterium sp.]